MSRMMWLVTLGAAAAGGLLFLVPARAASAQEAQEVIVNNFPETQRVAGAVSISGTILQAALFSLREVEVPPNLEPSDARRLVLAGRITSDGFGAVVLSLVAHMKGKQLKSGKVGAILIPDEEPIVQALDEKGQILFPLEVNANVAALGPDLFSSAQPRYVVAFPRYRVYLYNTTQTVVTADLYAWLTN